MIRYILAITALTICTGISNAGEIAPQPPEKDGSLTKLAGEMTKAHGRLEAEHHGSAVQVTQKKIADALDRLIKKIEKAKPPEEPPSTNPPDCPPAPGTPTPDDGNGPPQSSNTASSSMRRESMTSGSNAHGIKALLGSVGAKWGELPGRTQREVLQACKAKFPLHYRRMLIAYLICIADME
jgi:hypothetical protein